MDDFLAKPFKFDDLKDILENWLDSSVLDKSEQKTNTEGDLLFSFTV